MDFGMIAWMSLLLLSMGVILFALLSLKYAHEERIRWMRIFSEKLGVSVDTMEDRPETIVQPEPKPRKKLFSVPVPWMPKAK